MKNDRDESLVFTPQYDLSGLIPVVTVDATSGEVLMLAWMNEESLRKTRETGQAHYWSRSRNRLWRKGEESGHVQTVRDIRVDCDQDALLLLVDQAGDCACHTGRRSCFYRSLNSDGRTLVFL
ncbi:MAG: phosphoribosyl-AMP cyclohydrolase [Rhodospirillales bacterium]|nr:phosphoribosyl-AMP cyclohydrolase [Rhodospirillales bacterium]